MKVSYQKKVPIHRDRLITDDREEFYEYMCNVLRRINELFFDVQTAINYEYAVAELYQSGSQSASNAEEWTDVEFSDTQTPYERIKLIDNTDVKLLTSGWFFVTYGVTFQNTKGSALKTRVALRLLKNGEELRGSCYLTEFDRTDGAYLTVSGLSTVARLYKNDVVKLQFYVGDTSAVLNISDNTFDDPNSVCLSLIQLEDK